MWANLRLAQNGAIVVELDSLDAVAAAPEHHLVLLEDSRIRVLETRIAPGDETKIHTHVWGGYLYIISWSDFIRYDENRNIMLQSADLASAPEVGMAIWAPPLPPHSLRNVGDRDIHVILTEFKDGYAPEAGGPSSLPADSHQDM
jgi:quercetin dioxygenase-like cupin family protein